jgi:RimJ/RimL family protein N-acetyltransferase
MKLRNAKIDDAKLLYEWVNDPEVRSMSFSTKPIEWESHKAWFEQKINDKKVKIFIAMKNDNEPVGQIRFEIIDNSYAEVGIHVKNCYRNRGIGWKIIEMGTNHFFDISSVTSIYATIKITNERSKYAFLKAGFSEIGKKFVYGQECFHLVSVHPKRKPAGKI